MLFGGKLASFLVCDTCKKVSVTYEDFNDLSLSIKPEDYVKERKRDRFKLLAQKLRLRPKELDVSAAMAGIIPVQRSSSVPVTPARRSMDTLPHDPEPPVNVDHRRRSFDTHGGTDEANEERTARDVVKDLANTIKGSEEAVEIDEDLEVGAAEHKDPKATGRVEFAELSKDDNGQERRADGEHKKEKDDAWGKLGRRISVSMGMSKKDKRMSRSKDRGLKAKHLKDDASSRVPSEERAPRIPIRSAADSGSELGDVSDVAKSRGISPSPAPSPLSSPAFINPVGPFPNIRRSSGLALADKLSKPMTRLPKPSKEEIAYMRQVLADVHPSSHNTFSMLHQALSGGNSSSPNLSTAPTTAQALLVKLGHLPGIEECLRLFTAVELMDGENMVGCHRCWKIANGTYKPHNHVDSQEADGEESEDSSQDDRVLDISKDAINAQRDEEHGEDIQTSSPDSPGYVMVSSSSTPSFPRSASSSSLFLHDTTSVPSAPTTMQSHTEDEGKQQPRSSSAEETVTTYGGMPIPFISTTAPDTPVPSAPATARVSSDVSAVRDLAASLLSPATKRHRRRRKASGLDESTDSSGNESYDSASDISGDASAYSDASSVASPSASPTVSPRTSLEKLRESVAALRPPNDTTPSGSSTSPARKVPHSQQVIMRRTFKRYLIAVPPPILVVHLKRFQQISKNNPYAMAFSGGFKKLDDFVAFPEYLDLKPFLAPKKEDFGLGKKKRQE
ncbi:hypothetical protein EW026_g2432 [Hermanssonia centrifuga]|uniref:Peptidase C19 ubiquitin carboxyl-terminal hydrolase domain-containing protein n=1 Tax=Hermanssonia centrifuga TaxID=98765 RepID=A0A4S4KSY3_9APHY|nr:hypothetical protein EW026_g2432 [Hermanssonia centrifuga]